MYKFHKISIVTPVYNCVYYLEFTIKSVLDQGYPNLEYIIIDGGSTDGSVDIIKKYDKKISFWCSESDKGMYDALNKGFSGSSGEIMTWINSDDMLMPNSLFLMNKVMQDLPYVNWIHGLKCFLNENSEVIHTSPAPNFNRFKYNFIDFKWIQQESTFWSRKLWDMSGGYINTNLNLAGDFELWTRFFEFDILYKSNIPIGAWRKREGQLSGMGMDKYLYEVESVKKNIIKSSNDIKKIRKINFLKYFERITKIFKILNSDYFKNKSNYLIQNPSKEIIYSHKTNKFTIK